jgi:hypothetical protein
VRFDKWKLAAAVGAFLIIAVVVIVGISGGSPNSTKKSNRYPVVQENTSEQCATAAATFETAVQAYKANNNGTTPAGSDAPAIARTLTLTAGGGPFLESAVLQHYDANNPLRPATGTTTQRMIKSCKAPDADHARRAARVTGSVADTL